MHNLPDFTQDDEVISEEEWQDLREQCAQFSPDSIWRKLLAAHDREQRNWDPMGQPSTDVKSEERPQVEPFILMEEAGRWTYHMTAEELRIVMVALAGFDLTPEEKSEIRNLYMCIHDALNPGLKKKGDC